MKIILDAMGGDNAPEAPVLGAVQAAEDYGAQITLVGRGEEILEVLRKHNILDLPAGVEIADAEDVVDMHDDPGTVLHKRKDSSMVVGLKLLAEGKGDAFISAGSTGALLTGATLLARFFAGDMDALSLGSAHAHDLGVRSRPVMILLTTLAALLAAGTVALAGIIGFCGLVIPHVIRRLHGQSHRKTVLPAVLGGGVFLMLCDIVSRLGEIREIPIGVITALTGGPVFLWLLNRRKGA